MCKLDKVMQLRSRNYEVPQQEFLHVQLFAKKEIDNPIEPSRDVCFDKYKTKIGGAWCFRYKGLNGH